MEENAHPENLDPQATADEHNALEQSQEETGSDRRSFLTRAALGVAGAAGLAALSAQSGQAAEARNASAKSKILNRIQMQMAQQDVPLNQGGGGVGDGDDGYIKNSHALYIKA